MKKIIYILGLMILLVGCKSITANVKYNNINHKSSEPNGKALGHKNPKNPHYKQ